MNKISQPSLKEIVDLMKKNDIKKMPVLDSGKVIGVVRVEDLLYKKEEAPLPPILAINDLIITLPSNKTFQNKLQKLTAQARIFSQDGCKGQQQSQF